MEEVEFCFFPLSHLMRIMVLTFHQMFVISPIRSVSDVWPSNPIVVVFVNLYSVWSVIPFFVNFTMSSVYWQKMVFSFMRSVMQVFMVWQFVYYCFMYRSNDYMSWYKYFLSKCLIMRMVCMVIVKLIFMMSNNVLIYVVFVLIMRS